MSDPYFTDAQDRAVSRSMMYAWAAGFMAGIGMTVGTFLLFTWGA